jgi:hypothetical protein
MEAIIAVQVSVAANIGITATKFPNAYLSASDICPDLTPGAKMCAYCDPIASPDADGLRKSQLNRGFGRSPNGLAFALT